MDVGWLSKLPSRGRLGEGVRALGETSPERVVRAEAFDHDLNLPIWYSSCLPTVASSNPRGSADSTVLWPPRRLLACPIYAETVSRCWPRVSHQLLIPLFDDVRLMACWHFRNRVEPGLNANG